MKKLTYKLIDFLFIIIILLLTVGLNLQDNPPPGWYQQTLPVNDQINDIFFLDSLNGWIVTLGSSSSNDTGYILHTTNGGENWIVQHMKEENLSSIQFLNINTGYAAGGGNGTTSISFYKTTDGGSNWQSLNNIIGVKIEDLQFINKDTGWVCDDNGLFGGLYKTTNGGNSWVQQLGSGYMPLKLFFINKDTGWVGTNHINGVLYRTTNGGLNWNLQYTSVAPVVSIFFLTPLKGWIRGGQAGSNGIIYTTNGGLNWHQSQGEIGGFDIKFINDSIGYTGQGSFKILKSKNGGKFWGFQNSPIANNMSTSTILSDTLNAWAGGSGIVHTTDGGGPIMNINQISNVVPKEYSLYQNYPNPFNSTTVIKFEIRKSSNVKLIIFDIQGKQVQNLVNEKLSSGSYSYDWNASDNSSGVYFYRLVVDGNIIDTKKMLLIK